MNEYELFIAREAIYDEICRTLTNYESPENKEDKPTTEELYLLLAKIQNRWEDTITAEAE